MTEPAKTPGKWNPAWVTAGFVIAMSLLSTFTLSTPGANPQNVASQGPESVLVDGKGLPVDAGEKAIAQGGADAVGPASESDGGGGSADCARGQNAGSTDVGVTPNEIRFAATVVKSGIAKDFLSDAQWGMEAVRQKVNRGGGVCGRIITINYKDDKWDPTTGQRFIEGFIGEKKYLGLAVNPSSEGLRGPIESGVIRNNKFPVVGADGMLIGQYRDPWVWPVATSTSSVMHIMARNAWSRGARKFGIVWEDKYRFGLEGHAAFVGAVKRLGGKINSDVKVQGGQTDYGNQVDEFIGDCGGVDSLEQCEFIAMLLEPATAGQWVRNGGLGDGDVRPKVGIGGPQPLFLDSFARDCGQVCADMWVWTSFKPPIPPFDSEQAVATYKNDLKRVSATADANNPHVEGAYVGMLLLVKALEQLGPAPTRDGLRQTLDSMTLETGLTSPLTFRAGNHFAATSAQAFKAVVNAGSFSSWRYTNSGFIEDTEVGKDIPD